MQYMTEICDTRQDVPTLLQPPLFKTSVKTVEAVFFGAIIQRGIIVMTKPAIWPKSETVSIIGSALAPQVLNPIVTTRNASIIRVYCQTGNEKSGLVTLKMAWIRVVRTKTLLDTDASHPNVDIHPGKVISKDA